MSARSAAPSDRCGKAFGLVQMSSGLHVHSFRRQSERSGGNDKELNRADFQQIDTELREAFSADGDKRFGLTNLTLFPPLKEMRHTWLSEWSRHETLDIPRVFYDPNDPDSGKLPFPEALKWPDRDPRDVSSTSFVRVQRALDDPSYHDWNDRVIRQQDGDSPNDQVRSLQRLRDFFAWLYAQRRSSIFASNLSERIYHIWLPPGLLSHLPGGEERGGPLAILPLITMVRRPSQLEWRHTIGISMIFVPVSGEPGQPLGLRPLVQDGACELKDLARSLEGGSTRVLPSASTPLRLGDCPLKDYVTAVANLGRTPGLVQDLRSKICGWEGTRRQWIELFATVGADSVGIWSPDPHTHKRRLADAILRSLRLTTIWSAMLAGEGLDCLEYREGRQWPAKPSGGRGGTASHHKAAPRQPVQPPLERGSRSADFPAWAAAALDALSDPGSPPGPEDRIDDVSCSDVDYMTWRIPRRRCLLTAMGVGNEHFPGYSMLAASGWIGHMLVGAASATETMLELAMKTSQPGHLAEQARAAYESTIELEEMYDLDVTWLMYGQFFRNIRGKLGIDEQYTAIRERVTLLGRYTEVQESVATREKNSEMSRERSRTEKDNFFMAVTAAILAIVIISLTAFGPHIGSVWGGLSIGLSVLVVLTAGILMRRRHIRDQRRATQA